jgi:hypothetical protein
VLRQQNPRPQLDWASRAVPGALRPPSPILQARRYDAAGIHAGGLASTSRQHDRYRAIGKAAGPGLSHSPGTLLEPYSPEARECLVRDRPQAVRAVHGRFYAASQDLPSLIMDTVSLLVVPVRTRSGMASIRCGRLSTGQPVGVAFTSEDRLASVMGAGQPWIRLSQAAMKEMLEPLGVTRIQVDPGLIATLYPSSVPA